MAVTVVAPRTGVVIAESTANAAMHQARNRSTVKGVVIAEALGNAITNTQTANE